jgi:hypothetical protein
VENPSLLSAFRRRVEPYRVVAHVSGGDSPNEAEISRRIATLAMATPGRCRFTIALSGSSHRRRRLR